MKKFACPCGYVYDPEIGDPGNGVAPGTAWEDVPEDWVCPICGLGKDAFEEEQILKDTAILLYPFFADFARFSNLLCEIMWDI